MIWIAGCACLLCCGCVKNHNVYEQRWTAAMLQKMRPSKENIVSQKDVLEILGPPVFKSAFDGERRWYYVQPTTPGKGLSNFILLTLFFHGERLTACAEKIERILPLPISTQVTPTRTKHSLYKKISEFLKGHDPSISPF